MLNYEVQYFESKLYRDINLHFIPHKIHSINTNRISVNLIMFDGLSRMAFNQQFKETQQFLLSISKDYHIYDMLRYHTIGLNSRPNYVPLFYGIKYDKKPSKVILIILFLIEKIII